MEACRRPCGKCSFICMLRIRSDTAQSHAAVLSAQPLLLAWGWRLHISGIW